MPRGDVPGGFPAGAIRPKIRLQPLWRLECRPSRPSRPARSSSFTRARSRARRRWSRPLVSEDMRVAADELLVQPVDDAGQVALAPLLEQQRQEHDLKEDVAQLLDHPVVVAALSGLGQLAGLLDRVRDDRALVLLAVPGAFAPQAAGDLVEARERARVSSVAAMAAALAARRSGGAPGGAPWAVRRWAVPRPGRPGRRPGAARRAPRRQACRGPAGGPGAAGRGTPRRCPGRRHCAAGRAPGSRRRGWPGRRPRARWRRRSGRPRAGAGRCAEVDHHRLVAEGARGPLGDEVVAEAGDRILGDALLKRLHDLVAHVVERRRGGFVDLLDLDHVAAALALDRADHLALRRR